MITSFKKFLIGKICKQYEIENYTINEDLSIDVDDNVDLRDFGLKELPLKFRNVTGRFYCQYNYLTSLKGAPKSVGEEFSCSKNRITTFDDFPDFVGSDLYCEHNPVYQIYLLNPCKDFVEMMKEYKVIKNGKIIEIRLRQALEDSGCEKIPHYQHLNYEFI